MRLLFGPDVHRPIRVMKSQGSWQVFLEWNLRASPWFDTWEQARDFASEKAEFLRALNKETGE